VSNADRLKWDERYREGSYEARTYPTELLEEWLPRLPRGRALDIACGAGRNSLYLAANGYRVDAIDISGEAIERARASALARGLEINWIVADLDDAPLPPETYDVIFIARFLHRGLMPRAKEALRQGGVFLFEHHLISSSPVGGPGSREFRLRPNELLHLFWDLRVLYYREHLDDDRDGRRMALAEIVACKGGCGF
jgi:SAM-dependent methyltransferase